jgi:RNA polymerase sigma-70 factor (ECF subfamily)
MFDSTAPAFNHDTISSPRLSLVPPPTIPAPPPVMDASWKQATNRELMDRARVGDAAAFATLTRRLRPKIFSTIKWMTKGDAEAEDLTQETFLRAYLHLATFNGQCEPHTWLYAIARNLARNFRGSGRAREATMQLDPDDPYRDALIANVSRNLLGEPADDLERKRDYFVLCEAIDALSEKYRAALILVCVEGLEHWEAGRILNIPEGTVSFRLFEARRQLREALENGTRPAGERRRALVYKGEEKTFAEWLRDPEIMARGLTRSMIEHRLARGWSVEKSFETDISLAHSRRKLAS